MNAAEMGRKPLAGRLYVVATPIGNLADLTERAKQVLAEVDVVAAEDTRRTRHLLAHLGLRKKLVSYREQNRAKAGQAILAALEVGQDVALVSDAGTPAVFDPGTDLVRLVHQAGRGVVPIPGPAAAAAALSVAGLPAQQYTLAGFLPAKAKARRERLTELGRREDTLVFFETPHRLAGALADLAAIYGPRPAVLCRELTKLNEEVRRSDLPALVEWAREKEAGAGIKGEFCLVVAGRPPEERPPVGPEELAQAWRSARAEGLPPSQAARRVAQALGLPKAQVYRVGLDLDGSGSGRPTQNHGETG